MGKVERKTLIGRSLIVGILLLGLLAPIHSCTVSRAQGDTPPADGTPPAAPAPPAGDGKQAAPADKDKPSGDDTADDSDDNSKDGGPPAPVPAVGPQQSGQPAPPVDEHHGRHGREASQTAPASAPGDSTAPTTAGQAAPNAPAAGSTKAGEQSTGFSELEKGWPEGSGSTDDTASGDQQQQELAPSMKLTDEGRDFAGRWVAAVINKDGQAHLLGSEDEWAFNLGLDGRCSARQRLDGKYWEQSGWWQLQGETLTLSLGPGGVWVFGLQQQGSDIAIWTRAVEDDKSAKFTLFCVKTPETKMPPGLGSSYNSDFGPLRFQPSGPGHWRSSYGDPAGKLTVARVGGFLAGRWEQQPGVGFVLFHPTSSANSGAATDLDGVWWYAGSSTFDGAWHVQRAR